MKRSNRLVLLVGVFLAIVAFVGVLLLMQTGPKDQPQATTAPTVIATTDIPLGTRIAADQVTVQQLAPAARDADAYGDPSQVVGQIVRVNVASGAAITPRTFGQDAQGACGDIQTPAGFRAMAVQVDQVTGVGTVIKNGDYVDMITGFQGDKFPVITVNPADDSFNVVSGVNSTSVKLLLQGMQVLCTLLPPPDPNAQPPAEGEETGGGGTTLTGQQEIVILAVQAQQAEVIKFAQLDGSISLVLRSPDDFIDPTTGDPLVPVTSETTGVILKTLVDTYGVLPPEVIETVLPANANP